MNELEPDTLTYDKHQNLNSKASVYMVSLKKHATDFQLPNSPPPFKQTPPPPAPQPRRPASLLHSRPPPSNHPRQTTPQARPPSPGRLHRLRPLAVGALVAPPAAAVGPHLGRFRVACGLRLDSVALLDAAARVVHRYAFVLLGFGGRVGVGHDVCGPGFSGVGGLMRGAMG